MKQILISILILILAGSTSFAQERPEPQQENQGTVKQHQHQQEKKKYPSREELQSQKIAFFTQELDLTPEEAQKFWPVYNEAGKKLQAARKEINMCLKELHTALKSETPASDAEIKLLMGKYFKACEAEIETQSDNFEEIAKIIPVHKAAKTFSLEERFRVMLIKQLRR